MTSTGISRRATYCLRCRILTARRHSASAGRWRGLAGRNDLPIASRAGPQRRCFNRRSGRRLAADLGSVPRRADDRSDEHDRPRPECGRQPRIRSRRGRIAAADARRLRPGQCRLVSVAPVREAFAGANFAFIATNVVERNSSQPYFAGSFVQDIRWRACRLHRRRDRSPPPASSLPAGSRSCASCRKQPR